MSARWISTLQEVRGSRASTMDVARSGSTASARRPGSGSGRPRPISTEAVGALVRGIDARGWGAATVTLTEPVSAAALAAWSDHGPVTASRRIEVARDLAELPEAATSPLNLRPFFDDRDASARLLAEICRGAALLDGAGPDDVVAHFLALGGPDTSGWTIAWSDGRPAGLFLAGGGAEGDLWRIGLAPWARGRGWEHDPPSPRARGPASPWRHPLRRRDAGRPPRDATDLRPARLCRGRRVPGAA